MRRRDAPARRSRVNSAACDAAVSGDSVAARHEPFIGLVREINGIAAPGHGGAAVCDGVAVNPTGRSAQSTLKLALGGQAGRRAHDRERAGPGRVGKGHSHPVQSAAAAEEGGGPGGVSGPHTPPKQICAGWVIDTHSAPPGRERSWLCRCRGGQPVPYTAVLSSRPPFQPRPQCSYTQSRRCAGEHANLICYNVTGQ